MPAATRSRQRVLSAIGGIVLLAQLGSVVYAHTSGTRRYFAWAPNDYAVDYTISVSVDGRRLAPSEIRHRYLVADHGLYEDPPQRLIDFIDRYERTYGAH